MVCVKEDQTFLLNCFQLVGNVCTYFCSSCEKKFKMKLRGFLHLQQGRPANYLFIHFKSFPNVCKYLYILFENVYVFSTPKISGRVPRKTSCRFSLHDCSQHPRLGHVKLLSAHVEWVAWVHFLPKGSSL